MNIVEKFNLKKQELLAKTGIPALPLRHLVQTAHLTAPASDLSVLKKAIENGHAGALKILNKFGIGSDELAQTLGISGSLCSQILNGPPHAPLVLVDGEDAQALRPDVVEAGRKNAIEAFTTAHWGNSLRYYRPSGLELDFCMDDIWTVLTGVARESLDRYPIDGIIFPKVNQAAEVALIFDLLDEVEKIIGLPENSIHFQFLVESGQSVQNLAEICRVASRRLTGIVFGIADYSADIGLPVLQNAHPANDWARCHIVNAAGAWGVPAIDAMSMNYPVCTSSMSEGECRQFLLSRMKEVFEDASHGHFLGMAGKWVGHPLQLLAVRLAYESAADQLEIEAEVQKIKDYQKAIEGEKGAVMIAGVMTDRATDRHSRELLRKAIVQGKLSAQTGRELGLISAAEFKTLSSRF